MIARWHTHATVRKAPIVSRGKVRLHCHPNGRSALLQPMALCMTDVCVDGEVRTALWPKQY